MNFKTTVHSKESFKTSRWRGGETCELCIFPPGSDFLKREFLFRISSAAVEVPESVFSSFAGYTRYITVLDGSMELNHNGHHSISLLPYDIDRFDGSWDTKSKGCCTDFNFIFKNELQGNMKIADKSQEYTSSRIFVYCHLNNISVTLNGKAADLEKGCLLEIENPNNEPIILSTPQDSSIIIISIQ